MTRTKPARLSLDCLEGRAVPAGLVAVGTDAGVPAEVRIFADRDDNDGLLGWPLHFTF